jgi:sugar phosphate isomerase/epimerase
MGCRTTAFEFCPLSESDLHIPTWIAALRGAGLDVPLIIEDFQSGMSGAERLRRDVPFLAGVIRSRGSGSGLS